LNIFWESEKKKILPEEEGVKISGITSEELVDPV